MKLPVLWLLDYLPESFQDENVFASKLKEACDRWDIAPAADNANTLARLMTFAGFNCDGVHGSGKHAILDLDVLSNRPDCQGILGLAREVAAVLHVKLFDPDCDATPHERGENVNDLAQVRVDDHQLCPRYTARVIRGVKIGPSPQWLQERITLMGLTPRNNVVDVTNFICFEMNQPLHAFDLNKLQGRQIIVRRAHAKENFTPLYGETPPLTSETLVIADAENAQAIAGILGGKGAETSNETIDILLESACFNPANTRRTVRRLKIMEGRGTDSSYRFERGVDIENVGRASERAAALIAEISGGKVAPGMIDRRDQEGASHAREILLRHDSIERVFGAPVPKNETEQILRSIGVKFEGECQHDGICAKIPSWRYTDLKREIDLIEEVARLYGYNHVPETTAMSARVPHIGKLERTTNRLRDLLTALGYFEAVSDSLTDPRWPSPPIWHSDAPLPLDPICVLREDHSTLRANLLTSLLAVRKHNQDHRAGEARFFEAGKVFLGKKGLSHPVEKHVLCILDDRGFQALTDTVSRLGAALELNDGAHIKMAPLMPGKAPDFIRDGKGCRIVRVRESAHGERAENAIGWLGVPSQALLAAFDLRKAPAFCEIDLDALADLPSAPLRYSPPAEFPEVMRDAAIVVSESVNWADIESFASSHHEPLRDTREAVRFLSVYRGPQAGEGKKSVAFSLVYRAADRTLTDDEVNAAHERFTQALLSNFKAELRK